VALHSAYKWFPDELRTLPTAIIAQGAGIGIMVALPLLNWVIVHHSWHWAFGVLGMTGLAWTAAWLALGREGPLTASAMARASRRSPWIERHRIGSRSRRAAMMPRTWNGTCRADLHTPTAEPISFSKLPGYLGLP
jgi:MFS family permease